MMPLKRDTLPDTMALFSVVPERQNLPMNATQTLLNPLIKEPPMPHRSWLFALLVSALLVGCNNDDDPG